MKKENYAVFKASLPGFQALNIFFEICNCAFDGVFVLVPFSGKN